MDNLSFPSWIKWKCQKNNGNGNSNTQLHKLMIYKLASIPIADEHFVMRSRTIRLHYRGGYTSFLFVLVCVFFLLSFFHVWSFSYLIWVAWDFVVSLFFLFHQIRCVLSLSVLCVVVFIRRAMYTILNAFVRKIIFDHIFMTIFGKSNRCF